MPEVHGGLQARVRLERRFGYGERCRTPFRARADGCAATNPGSSCPAIIRTGTRIAEPAPEVSTALAVLSSAVVTVSFPGVPSI